MSRAAFAVLVLCGLVANEVSPAVALAQGRVQVGVRASYVPLSEGNATFGPTRGLGLTTQVGLTLDSIGASELSGFYTLVPRSEALGSRRQRIQMAGALLSLTRGIERAFTVMGAIGLGVINYTAWGGGPCDLPFCSPDGGGRYGGGRHPTFIGGLGLEGAATPRVRLRADVRAHIPLGADDDAGFPGERRTEYGLGVSYVVR
jgi:hypothetical protein